MGLQALIPGEAAGAARGVDRREFVRICTMAAAALGLPLAAAQKSAEAAARGLKPSVIWLHAGVSFVEIGTPGLDLIPYIADADALLLVDTVRAFGRPGEIRLYGADRFERHAARPRLGPHDPGLQEALQGLRFAGRGPADLLLVGVIPGRVSTGIGLSPAVRSAVPAAVEVIARELAERGVRLRRLEPPARPDIWWERSGEGACAR